jgi:hypothetical protein
MERLDRPDKHWKYNPGDVDTRRRWDDYQEAYADVFARTDTDVAPWHVIPADRKWYSRLAVTELLTQALVDLDLSWPPADFDVEEERRRLAGTMRPQVVDAARASSDEVVAKHEDQEAAFREAVAEARRIRTLPPEG